LGGGGALLVNYLPVDFLQQFLVEKCASIFCFIFSKNAHLFQHEQMSCKIFDYIYEEEPGLRATLDEYLDETDRIFIKELIDTPKNLVDSKGEWVPKGRPREKAFLFQIVNDPISGFDVGQFL
jgi:hypothetical protein